MKEQNRDGSWGNHTRTKGLNVLCPYPEGPRSFRTASTSLCVIGLLTSPLKEDPAVKASLDKALQYLLTTLPTLKRGDTRTVLGVWGHAYGLSALSRAARNLPADAPLREELKKVASLQVKALDQMADVQGGWGYYTFETFSKRPIGEPTSFLTATVLLAYKDAEQAFGLKAEPRIVKRAVACLEKLRTPAGSYVYSLSHSFYPGRPINRHTGSLARTPAGDLALMRYDPSFISRSQLEDGLERIWSRGGWLSLAVKKPIPHESFAQNAGYFSITGIITPPAAWRKWRRNTWRAMRPIWQATSCPCRKKTGPGGTIPCTITINSTAPDMPYMPSPASENPCIPLMRQQLHDPCSAR